MVMEVVTEGLNVGNVVVAALGGKVSREQDYMRVSQSVCIQLDHGVSLPNVT